MVGVKSSLFDRPRRSGIATYAKARARRRDHELGPGWMCADLMNIAVDIDRRLPGDAGVSRSRNSAHVDVGEKHGAIACRRHRSNSKRWPDDLAVDDRGSCVPFVAAWYVVETGHALLCAVRIETKNTRIIGSSKHDVADGYTARKFEVGFCYLSPFAAGGSSTKGVPANNREHSAASIGHQTAHRLIGEFLLDDFPGDME